MKLLRINSFVFSLLIACQLNAQLLVENFEYSTGTLTGVTSNWSESPTGTTDLEVVDGNLNYTDYPASNIGKMIFLDGGATGRSGVIRTFSEISENGNSVYVSFLISLTDANDLDNNSSSGDYFFELKPTSGSVMRAYIYVREGGSFGTFNLGFAKASTSSLTWFNQDLDINTTYLIVVSYQFQAGEDAVKLWLNPDLTGVEPAPDLTITTGSDADNIAIIQFRQEELSGNINIDGIRVATSWDNAPLPVELTDFNATWSQGVVKLDWTTATEVNNYGFEVERLHTRHFLAGENKVWIMLGFVNGHGNCNSPKCYSFIDYKPISGINKYRFKQIDTDGAYSYSEPISVTVHKTGKINLLRNYPNPFNPSTTISFFLQEKSNIKIILYDIVGNELCVLKNEFMHPGEFNYRLDFNRFDRPLPSGVYIVKFLAAGTSEFLKVVYVK